MLKFKYNGDCMKDINNKGFTLIELVAIVIILAVIFSFSFPSLLSSAKKDHEEKYKSLIDNVCLAGESYIYSNIDDYNGLSNVGYVIEINVSDLIRYGTLKKEINSNTNKSIEYDKLKYTVLNDYSLNCEYID